MLKARRNNRRKDLKMFSKLKEWFIWLTSKEVGKAIDDGKSYEEVEQIVRDRVKVNFKK